MSARSRALIPLSAEQQAAMQRWLSQNNVVVRDASLSAGLMPPLSFAA